MLNLKKKKAQYIAYILVGFFILLLSIGFFIRIKTIQNTNKKEVEAKAKEGTNPRTDSVYLIKRCIVKETKNALILAASQGGVLNISKFKNNGKTIYWFYWNDSIPLNSSNNLSLTEEDNLYKFSVFIENIPSLQYLKQELEPYLKKRIDKCIDKFREVRKKYNIIVDYKIKDIKITFFDKKVRVDASIPFTIIDINTGKIEDNKGNFNEIVEIPYKEKYEKLKRLVEEIYSKGLYSYEYLFLQSLSPKIPITIANYLCNRSGMEYDIKEIKKEIQKILKYGRDFCYYKCKEKIYQPFLSLDNDLDVFFSNDEIINTQFLNIRYFDVFLNPNVKNPKDRYKDSWGNYIEKNIIHLVPKTPEEYFNKENLPFKGKYDICKIHIFYDLIFNVSLTYRDSKAKVPLTFNIMLDSGLVNNRPITLTFAKQYKEGKQPFVIHNNTYSLWPRRGEIIFFRNESYWNNIQNLLSINSLTLPKKEIKTPDVYITLDTATLKERIPRTYSIFCFPFGIKIENKPVFPLASFCSKGSILIKNQNYSGLVNIESLRNFPLFYKNIDGLNVINYPSTYLVNKNDFLKNMDKKINVTLINIPFLLDIIEMFNQENFEEPEIWIEREYQKNSSKITMISILSPSIFNPLITKIINDKNQTTQKVVIYTDKNIPYSDIFVHTMLYGSVFNYINTTEAKMLIFDKDNIINKYFAPLENENITHIIPVVIYGTKVVFKKTEEKGILIEPVIYKIFLFINNQQLKETMEKLYNNLSNQIEKINELGDIFMEDKIKELIEQPLLKIVEESDIDNHLKSKLENYIKENTKKIISSSCFFGFCLKSKVLNNIDGLTNDFRNIMDNYMILLVDRVRYYNLHTSPSINETIKKLKPINEYKNGEIGFEMNTEKFNEVLSNPLYFGRQKIFEDYNKIKPFFGKKIDLISNIKIDDIDLNLLLNNFEGIIITLLNCTSEDEKDNIIWFLSDLGFSKTSLNITPNLGENKYQITQYLPKNSNCKLTTKAIIKKTIFEDNDLRSLIPYFHTLTSKNLPIEMNIVIDLSKKMCKKIDENERLIDIKTKGNIFINKKITYLDVIKKIVKEIYEKKQELGLDTNTFYVYDGNLKQININEVDSLNCVDTNLEIKADSFPSNKTFYILGKEDKIIRGNTNEIVKEADFTSLSALKKNYMNLFNKKETDVKIVKEVHNMITNTNTVSEIKYVYNLNKDNLQVIIS